MKKSVFRIVNRFNKKFLPKYSHLDPTKLTKFQKGILAFRYYVLINSLDWYFCCERSERQLFPKQTYSLSFWKNLNIVLNNLEDCFQRIERFQKLPCHCEERSNQGWIQKIYNFWRRGNLEKWKEKRIVISSPDWTVCLSSF